MKKPEGVHYGQTRYMGLCLYCRRTIEDGEFVAFVETRPRTMLKKAKLKIAHPDCVYPDKEKEGDQPDNEQGGDQ